MVNISKKSLQIIAQFSQQINTYKKEVWSCLVKLSMDCFWGVSFFLWFCFVSAFHSKTTVLLWFQSTFTVFDIKRIGHNGKSFDMIMIWALSSNVYVFKCLFFFLVWFFSSKLFLYIYDCDSQFVSNEFNGESFIKCIINSNKVLVMCVCVFFFLVLRS